jgi:hypothetical protein
MSVATSITHNAHRWAERPYSGRVDAEHGDPVGGAGREVHELLLAPLVEIEDAARGPWAAVRAHGGIPACVSYIYRYTLAGWRVGAKTDLVLGESDLVGSNGGLGTPDRPRVFSSFVLLGGLQQLPIFLFRLFQRQRLNPFNLAVKTVHYPIMMSGVTEFHRSLFGSDTLEGIEIAI